MTTSMCPRRQLMALREKERAKLLTDVGSITGFVEAISETDKRVTDLHVRELTLLTSVIETQAQRIRDLEGIYTSESLLKDTEDNNNDLCSKYSVYFSNIFCFK